MAALFLKSPCIPSPHITARLPPGYTAALKLENVQPAQSFKSRGISLFIERCVANAKGADIRVITASGGNAGLATACAAKTLGVRCTIYVTNGASPGILAFMKQQEAEVVEGGDLYVDALRSAQADQAADELAVMVPAYDDPVLWEGHSSMVTELKEQLANKPAAIICSVGGGGLLGGIITGCEKEGWDDVPIIAMETLGSNSFYSSMALNNDWKHGVPEDTSITLDEKWGVKVAKLKQLTSKATSLGASSSAAGVISMALKRKGGIKCVCVRDAMSMSAAVSFAEDHKILVELACSTTLTAAYEPGLISSLVPAQSGGVIVFIVCGGFKISLKEMDEYSEIVKKDLEDGQRTWEGTCNGVGWSINKYGTN